MKKRRVDAKLRLEGLSESEEEGRCRSKPDALLSQVPSSSQVRGARPKSVYQPIALSGDCFGEVLELWGFLVTFSEPLGIRTVPTLRKLLDAFRFSDPFVKDLCAKATSFSRCLDNVVLRCTQGEGHRLPYDSSHQSMADAKKLLNRVGVALVRPLLHEFYKLMGMEGDLSAEASKYILHDLTWMEIARYVTVVELFIIKTPMIISFVCMQSDFVGCCQ
jgi:hypothetical protein